MLLCNIALAISQTQLKLVLLDAGATPAGTATLISVAVGSSLVLILGRINRREPFPAL